MQFSIPARQSELWPDFSYNNSLTTQGYDSWVIFGIRAMFFIRATGKFMAAVINR